MFTGALGLSAGTMGWCWLANSILRDAMGDCESKGAMSRVVVTLQCDCI